jgi:hypothetical protein
MQLFKNAKGGTPKTDIFGGGENDLKDAAARARSMVASAKQEKAAEEARIKEQKRQERRSNHCCGCCI